MSRHDIRLKLNRFQIQEKMFLDMEVAQKYKKKRFYCQPVQLPAINFCLVFATYFSVCMAGVSHSAHRSLSK